MNEKYILAYKATFNKIKKGGSNVAELVKKAYSQVDKAVKRHIIHRNKGNRLKSNIARLVKSIKKTPAVTRKKKSK